jgi:hypothetical protein
VDWANLGETFEVRASRPRVEVEGWQNPFSTRHTALGSGRILDSAATTSNGETAPAGEHAWLLGMQPIHRMSIGAEVCAPIDFNRFL